MPLVTMQARAVLGVLPLLFVAACADVWGLQDLSEAVDASVEATMPAQEASSGGQPSDGASDVLEATAEDAADGGQDADSSDGRGGDAAHDGEAGPDVGVDAPADVGPDVTPEAEAGGPPDTGPPDAGCGPLNTPMHCGSCTQSCDTTTGVPSCNGVSCSYTNTCNPGHADCDVSLGGLNGNGCECATPACCGTGCETLHRTGLSLPLPTSLYDCNPVASPPGAAQAQAACEAFAGVGACHTSAVNCNCITIVCGATASSYCGTAGGQCYCWQYNPGGTGLPASHPGTVQPGTGAGCTAACGASTDPTFD
jgi:hypothetical protein